MPSYCIIGAGISGLAHAWQLRLAGHSVTVLETSPEVGGSITSYQSDGYLAEEGPHTLLVQNKKVNDFLDSIPELLEAALPANPTAKKRFILRDGNIVTAPLGPMEAIKTPLLSTRAKLRLLKEPFIKKQNLPSDESVSDFIRRRLGPEVEQYAVNPFVGGIYAGDPKQLSLKEAFPKLYHLEQTHGSLLRGALKERKHPEKNKIPRRILSFQNGMSHLPKAICKTLGNTVQTGVTLQSIQQVEKKWQIQWSDQNGVLEKTDFDYLLVTVPAHRVSAMPFDEAIKERLHPFNKIIHPPVSVLSLGFKRSSVGHPLDGFGLLIPECENRKVLGALFPSTLFTNRAPQGHVLIAAFIGGTRQPELASENTDAVLETALSDLKPLLGLESKPTFVHHKHWTKAIPQYTLNYGLLKDHFADLSHQFSGLHFAGNYRSGISVTQCIESAVDFSTSQ
jgi:oxygen-dependent protoporphyrinogen oxidase